MEGIFNSVSNEFSLCSVLSDKHLKKGKIPLLIWITGTKKGVKHHKTKNMQSNVH